uniref:FUN14 domain-containing protein 1 n=1 Tax=Heliothis virescens TaxID=7102 RepID=A0A2A4K882_HELVI
MARPIPNKDLSNVTKHDDKDVSPKDSYSFLDVTIDGIKSNTGKNLILGTVSGWATGVSVVRVGRVAAFGLGGGIILLHFACECGYIHVNWERVKEAAGESQAWLEKLLHFVKRNSCFSVGFFGGFFFGVAST